MGSRIHAMVQTHRPLPHLRPPPAHRPPPPLSTSHLRHQPRLPPARRAPTLGRFSPPCFPPTFSAKRFSRFTSLRLSSASREFLCTEHLAPLPGWVSFLHAPCTGSA